MSAAVMARPTSESAPEGQTCVHSPQTRQSCRRTTGLPSVSGPGGTMPPDRHTSRHLPQAAAPMQNCGT